jgi:DNA primase
MKTYSGQNLSSLTADHSYWVDRGISEETIRLFRGGVDDGIEGGKMQGRYVFPILNSKQEIVGFSGRLLSAPSEHGQSPKWKHLGQKGSWVYPAFLNKKTLQEKREIILVESIGDALALYNCGVENILVTFGLDVGLGVLTYLLKLNSQRIIISLNNDEKTGAGNNAAKKMYRTVTNHFDKKQVQIYLPTKNDFGDMSKEEIWHWREQVN